MHRRMATPTPSIWPTPSIRDYLTIMTVFSILSVTYGRLSGSSKARIGGRQGC